jgi:hypothetical protein
LPITGRRAKVTTNLLNHPQPIHRQISHQTTSLDPGWGIICCLDRANSRHKRTM